MKPIEECFPNVNGNYNGAHSYSDLIKSMDVEALLIHELGEYQGSSWCLLRRHVKNDIQYGFLVFGWGSCSGCDALETCGSYQELDSLRNQLFNSIRWDTAAGLAKYFINKDWKTEVGGTENGADEFLPKALSLILTVDELKSLDVLSA
jgi:hypothetical protein